VTVEQAIDEMHISGSTAAGADGEFARQMRLGTRREGRDLFVPHVDPFNLALAPQRVGQPVQAVAHDTINTLHAPYGESLRELVGYGFDHDILLCLLSLEIRETLNRDACDTALVCHEGLASRHREHPHDVVDR
jgi:hypothetical protein